MAKPKPTAPALDHRSRPRRPAPTPQQAIANADKAIAATNGPRKIGRPLTYTPELCERAIALGMRGHSWAGIARAFNIGRGTLNDWERDYPDFKDALARARAAAQARFEEEIWKARRAKHFQAQAIGKVMSAQFEDYREVRQGFDVTLDLGSAIVEVIERRSPKTLEGKVTDVKVDES